MNRLEAILHCSQYDNYNSRNGFFISNIFGGIINDLSLSKGVVKSRTTYLRYIAMGIQLCCYLLWLVWFHYRSLMLFFESMQIPWNSVSLVYIFGITETQGAAFLSSFRYIPVLLLHLYFSKWFLCLKTFRNLLL